MSNAAATPSALTPEQQAQALKSLLKAVRDSHILYYNDAAALTWVGYDIMLTMKQEVNRMWGHRMLSVPTLTYFFTRYYSLGFLIYNMRVQTNGSNTFASCLGYDIMQAMSIGVVSIMVNALIAIRVNAFFHGNPRVKCFVMVLWVCETLVEIVVSSLTEVASGKLFPYPLTVPITGCEAHTVTVPSFSIAAWVSNIVYSLICFSLIGYRFASIYFRGDLTPGLVKTFVRDGAMLFATVCVANIVNLILLFTLPTSPLTITGFGWFIAAFSIASSRTMLSLRGASRKGTGFTSEIEQTQMRSTSIAFAGRVGVPARRDQNRDLTVNSEDDIPLEPLHACPT